MLTFRRIAHEYADMKENSLSKVKRFYVNNDCFMIREISDNFLYLYVFDDIVRSFNELVSFPTNILLDYIS